MTPTDVINDTHDDTDNTNDIQLSGEIAISCEIIIQIIQNSSSLKKVLRTLSLLNRIKRNKSFRRAAQVSPTDSSQKEIFAQCVKATQESWNLKEGELPLHTKQLGTFKENDGILYTRLRFHTPEHMRSIYEATKLPVLKCEDGLTALIIRHSHLGGLGSHLTVLATSAQTRSGPNAVWIINLKKKVKQISSKCVTCRKVNSKPMGVRMASHPTAGDMYKPPFNTIQCDYAGPFLCKPWNKKLTRGRQPTKIWALIIVDTVTKATRIYPVESYSTESFETTFKIHISHYGLPQTITSDPMSGFMGTIDGNANGQHGYKTSEDPLTLCRVKWARNYPDVTWKVLQPGSQFKSGLVERKVGGLKRIMRTVFNRAPTMTMMQWHALFSEVSDIMNSTPLFVRATTEGFLTPVSPNHLLMGRQNSKHPPMDCLPNLRGPDAESYIEGLTATINAFWKAYQNQLISSSHYKVREMKPKPSEQEIKPGDIVLILYQSKLTKNQQRIGRVTQISKDKRNVKVNVCPPYNNLEITKWKPIKKMNVPIQRICRIYSSDTVIL